MWYEVKFTTISELLFTELLLILLLVVVVVVVDKLI